MVGSAVGISMIARLLGAGRKGQVVAALFVLTLPMGIMQGSSTQNDYVVTLWLVCCALFLLLLGENWNVRLGVLAAMSFALAVLTKGTGLILGLPMVLLWVVFFEKVYLRKVLVLTLVIISCVALNAAFYARMQAINGNLFTAYRLGGVTSVEQINVGAVASNAMRNAAMQLSLPWEAWNRAVESTVNSAHHYLKLDPQDGNTTMSVEKPTVRYSLVYLPYW